MKIIGKLKATGLGERGGAMTNSRRFTGWRRISSV